MTTDARPACARAYRGYLIRPDLTRTWWFVQKDGMTIATTASVDAAIRAVDEVAS